MYITIYSFTKDGKRIQIKIFVGVIYHTSQLEYMYTISPGTMKRIEKINKNKGTITWYANDDKQVLFFVDHLN